MMTSKSLAQGFALILLASPMLHAEPLRGVTWSWRRWTTDHGTITNANPAPVPVAIAPPPAAAPGLFLSAYVPAAAPAAPAYSPPAPTFVQAAAAPAAQRSADAFVNLSGGSFANNEILSGSQPHAWYDSPVVTSLYGGTPSDQQKADFSNVVLQRVNDTFHASGLNPTLTTDPNVTASHTLSVVSNVTLADSPGTIGLTDVGRSGFTFIDQLGAAKTVDDLATVIAKNVSHELMHAFGIGIHPDQTGQFIDSGTVSFDMLTNQNAKFSDQAAQDILATKYGTIPFSSTALGAQVMTPGYSSTCNCATCVRARQMLAAQNVPEPATMLIWSIAAVGGLFLARSEGKMRAA